MLGKCAILFSGGKDSTYAAYLAKKKGYELACLISVFSENKNSYMFHTPSIEKTKKQAEIMDLPLIIDKTKGEKEAELEDLERVIKKAKEEYEIDTIVTGAIDSRYQASRIQKICDDLGLECFNPLWKKDEIEYLEELVGDGFKVIITGVAAYPLDKSWLGREIDNDFISEVKVLHEKYEIHPAGEGGEFETFVLNCPLFKEGLKVVDKNISGEGNSWRMDVEVE
ncbi:MAG: diphthine--ammonia ligase [archaeon]